jgi:hypothetical protein
MHTWIVDRATKLFRRKKNSAFVEIATDKCGNINEKLSQIWSYVLVNVGDTIVNKDIEFVMFDVAHQFEFLGRKNTNQDMHGDI